MYLHNFNPKVYEQIVKLKSIHLCSNTTGQAMVEMMTNPPNLEEDSEATVKQYQ